VWPRYCEAKGRTTEATTATKLLKDKAEKGRQKATDDLMGAITDQCGDKEDSVNGSVSSSVALAASWQTPDRGTNNGSPASSGSRTKKRARDPGTFGASIMPSGAGSEDGGIGADPLIAMMQGHNEEKAKAARIETERRDEDRAFQREQLLLMKTILTRGDVATGGGGGTASARGGNRSYFKDISHYDVTQWCLLNASKCDLVIKWIVENQVTGDDIVELTLEDLKSVEVGGKKVPVLEAKRFIRALTEFCSNRGV